MLQEQQPKLGTNHHKRRQNFPFGIPCNFSCVVLVQIVGLENIYSTQFFFLLEKHHWVLDCMIVRQMMIAPYFIEKCLTYW
jgi:hypothetical protein